MKSLYLLRHAKSDWDDPALSDHDRPLKKRGIKAATRMGRLLKEEGIVPDLVLCSTATRARETLRIVRETANHAGQVQYLSTLYHCPVDNFVMSLRATPDAHSSVMIVGHNPGLEEFLHQLTGITPDSHPFSTAALAEIEIPINVWSDFNASTTGRLTRFWRPKELDAE